MCKEDMNLLDHEAMPGPHKSENITNSHFLVQGTKQLLMFVPFCFRYTGGILSGTILESEFGIERSLVCFHALRKGLRTIDWLRQSKDRTEIKENLNVELFAGLLWAIGETHIG